MNVRMTDPASGHDGLHVDRMISAIKESQSQTRVLIGDFVGLDVAAGATLGTYGFDQIFGSDDFTSMLQQWTLFRVRAIKFDIYDINPAASLYNVFGTWHDNYETSIPSYTRANIADLPDSRVISAGTGQTTLYWVAHGTSEEQFQSASSLGSISQRFGGLKYSYDGGTPAGKFALQVHAVVDFRGRR